MTWPRLLAGALSLLILAWASVVIVRSRERRFVGLFWIAVAVSLAFMALKPEVIESIGPDGTLLRLRIVTCLLSFLVLSITLEAVRRTHMLERYALLWVATGSILFLFSLFPHAGVVLEALTGMHYVTVIVGVIFVFLLLVAFHFSVVMSQLQAARTRLAQHCALLELRVAELEERLGDAPSEGSGLD